MPTFHSRSALLADGFTDSEIRSHLRSDTWQRLTTGRYLTEPLEELTPEERHALLTRAELSRFSSPEVMASHASAAALHGLPVIDRPLDRVDVIRNGSSGSRVSRHCRVRAMLVPGGDRTMVDSTPTTTIARTLVDLARTGARTTAVAAIDHALHHRLVEPDDVIAACGRIGSGPGLPRARRILRLADGRAESPGESEQRVILSDGCP